MISGTLYRTFFSLPTVKLMLRWSVTQIDIWHLIPFAYFFPHAGRIAFNIVSLISRFSFSWVISFAARCCADTKQRTINERSCFTLIQTGVMTHWNDLGKISRSTAAHLISSRNKLLCHYASQKMGHVPVIVSRSCFDLHISSSQAACLNSVCEFAQNTLSRTRAAVWMQERSGEQMEKM